MKLFDVCKPRPLTRNNNSVYFLGWLEGLNEVVNIKHLAWLLAHNKCSIKKGTVKVILTVTEDIMSLEGCVEELSPAS